MNKLSRYSLSEEPIQVKKGDLFFTSMKARGFFKVKLPIKQKSSNQFYDFQNKYRLTRKPFRKYEI